LELPLWGLLHGMGLAVSSNYQRALGRPGQAIAVFFERVPVAGWLLTLLFVGFGWLLFFYPLSTAIKMMQLLVGAA
jgi:hypothetical protein